MRSAEDLVGLNAAIAYRDGLLIAFLALIPLRRRNLADLVLEKTLVREGATGSSPSTRTTPRPTPRSRSGCRMSCGLRSKPISTTSASSAWRAGRWARPVEGALWVSKDGSPMTQMAIYDRIRARTKQHFGVAINPHCFVTQLQRRWPSPIRPMSPRRAAAGPSNLHDDGKILSAGARLKLTALLSTSFAGLEIDERLPQADA